MDAIQQRVVDRIAEIEPQHIELGEFIHQHLEIAMLEHAGSTACADFFEGFGFEVARGRAGRRLPLRVRCWSGPSPRRPAPTCSPTTPSRGP